MGAAIDALGTAARVTRDTPALVFAAWLLGGAVVAVGLLASAVPLVGPAVSHVLVGPVFVVGLLGMAVAAIDGRRPIVAFADSLSANYASVVCAFAVLYAVVGALLALGSSAASIALNATDVRVIAATGLPGWTLDPGALSAASLAIGAGVLPVTVVQFVDVSIVAGGTGALSAFAASWRLFRDDPLSVLCYTLLRVSLALGIVLVPAGLAAVAALAADSALVGVVVAAGVCAIVWPAGQAYLMVYHAAYYEKRVTA